LLTTTSAFELGKRC